jgi:hypothetical protein
VRYTFGNRPAVAIISTRVKPSAVARRIPAWCGVALVLMFAAGCSGSEEAPSTPTGPTPPPASTPPPTPSAPSNFSVTTIVSGGDCNATSNSPVSCTFVAQVTGGQGPFTYTWEFWSANEQKVTVSGQSARPILDCRVATGVTEFRVYYSVRVDPAGGGAPATAQQDQRVYRVAGHC